MKITAAVTEAKDQPFELQEVDLEEPRPDGTATQSVDFHLALVRAAHNSALLIMFLATQSLLA